MTVTSIGIAIVRQIGTDEEQSKHRPPAPTPRENNEARKGKG